MRNLPQDYWIFRILIHRSNLIQKIPQSLHKKIRTMLLKTNAWHWIPKNRQKKNSHKKIQKKIKTLPYSQHLTEVTLKEVKHNKVQKPNKKKQKRLMINGQTLVNILTLPVKLKQTQKFKTLQFRRLTIIFTAKL